jgi:hypothetical protein
MFLKLNFRNMTDHYRMKRGVLTIVTFLSLQCYAFAQVDTTFIYKTNMPYGTLDLRIAKSSTRYYYLQENKTFSFREVSPGVKSNTYRDMTSWDSSPYMQGNLREKNGSADYFILNYRFLLPVNYNKSLAKGYPLILMMPGAGERGNCWDNKCYHADRTYNPLTNSPAAPTSNSHELLNNDHNLLHGGKQHLDARNLAGSKLPDDPTLSSRAFPGFVLFPQSLNGWTSTNVQDAVKLVRLLMKKYNIDPDRIYIHGLSNGGIAVLETIKRAPWLFAAALPMSAPGDGGIISKNLQSTVSQIPMWFFQGGQDKAPTPAKTEGYVKSLRDAGAIVRYSLYPNLGHGVWNTAYKEPEFFKWMLDKRKSDIHVFGGNAAICTSNGQGVRMKLSPGFRAYQWEKNGVIISGATSASHEATTTGVYRARFSRKTNPGASDWNEWSDPVTVTTQTPAVPAISQTGTTLLKDLNGYNYAHLYSSTEAARYYWYKDGVLQNLTGSQDDTTRYPRFAAGTCTGTCTGNGKYTLVTATVDGCRSVPSAAKSVYFSDQASINIAAPTSFTGQSSSLSTVKLSWNETSTNEIGFEVWRRTVLGTSSYSKWEMRTLTAANIKTYTDVAAPGTTYHYKLRAVGTAGRSNYTPSASNSYLVVNTTDETTPPSVPQGVTAQTTGINTIKLSWSASTDNVGIKQYRIYFDSRTVQTGSTATTFTLSDLTLNKEYNFTIKAEDQAGNLSAASASVSGNTYVSGLYYQHSTGAWTSIDAINWNGVPEFTGHVPNVTLNPKTQADYFNFKFDGYLYLRTGGSYQFRTTSSDGSRVELNNVVVVDNNGVHGNVTKTGAITTQTSGPKRIVIKYFEYDGSETLTVYYKGPDTNETWIKIPDAAYSSRSSTSTMMASAGEAEMISIADSTADVPLVTNIYPNPTNDGNINLQVQTLSEDKVDVRLIDFTGREIYHVNIDAYTANEGIRIEPQEALLNGVYLLIVNHNGKQTQERISVRN